ncbi:hypothetical protein LPJ66_006384, partial [Kickxella alabastrina]
QQQQHLTAQSEFFEQWAKRSLAMGDLVPCDFCGERALPAGISLQRNRFEAADLPGPVVTRCGHIGCHQCQLALFGVGGTNAMTECVLCGDMVGQSDIVWLPASVVFNDAQSGHRVGAATMDQQQLQQREQHLAEAAEGSEYNELNRLCREQDSSTKATTLMQDIEKIRSRRWISDAHFGVDQDHPLVQARKAELHANREIREKCVVFSQWTTMLDLLEPLLRQRGIRFVRLDGKMTRSARETSLRVFKSDPGVEVILLSLRAGGVGLNLAYASHVFLMDAFWNPSVEQQAIDRIHRLGQKSPITVTRYFIKDSIEEKIMKLQRRKARIVDISLMDSTRNRNPGEAEEGEELAISMGTHSRQQRLDDLNMLFG